jgi:Fe-S-cluster-containing hydrogenase component 2
VSNLYSPLASLRKGHWFKLICGASFQHLPAIRNLALAYALAGADCIDVAADPAVIAATQEALVCADQLAEIAQHKGFEYRGRPLLMVSLNDGEDPHFRKAQFNPEACPADCPRPCESICPAQAIVFNQPQSIAAIGSEVNVHKQFSGVLDQRCYGCGRCVPVCPIEHILTRSYVSTPAAVVPTALALGIDALEIHTQVGRTEDFTRLWHAIKPWVHQLKLVAVSCPDGEELIDYLRSLYAVMSPLPCALIWQTDGRPMSGDIGTGTTRAAVKLGQKVLEAGLPGYVQLAGGTNNHTVAKLRKAGLLPSVQEQASSAETGVSPTIAGIAYGSYARVLLSPLLERLEESASGSPLSRLEEQPALLWEAVQLAHTLVGQLKDSLKFQQPLTNSFP